MTQLDDLQQYTNDNMPLRPILWTSTNTAYDGDPNAPGAPAVLGATVAGSQYHWETADVFYKKDAAGNWNVDGSGANVRANALDIYVDPVSGDDNNAGTLAAPIQTLVKLAAIMPVVSQGLINVYLKAGTHDWPDVAGGEAQVIFPHGTFINVYGDKSAALASFTTQSVTDNVITANGAPGWTPNQFKGKRIDFNGNVGGSPAAATTYIVLSNTANTVTVAATDSANGGFVSYPSPSDPVDIYEYATKIRQNPSNPFAFENRIEVQGDVSFYDVAFDQSINNDFGGIVLTGGAEIYFLGVDFIAGASTNSGCEVTRGTDCNAFATYFVGYSVGLKSKPGGGEIQIASDTVFDDCTAGVQSSTSLFINPFNTLWAPGCLVTLEGEPNSMTLDQCNRVWTQPGVNTPQAYFRAESFAKYAKIVNPAMAFPGSGTWSIPWYILDGPGQITFFDSALQTIAATSPGNWARTEKPTPQTISQADFVAGNPPATGVKQWEIGLGNFFEG